MLLTVCEIAVRTGPYAILFFTARFDPGCFRVLRGKTEWLTWTEKAGLQPLHLPGRATRPRTRRKRIRGRLWRVCERAGDLPKKVWGFLSSWRACHRRPMYWNASSVLLAWRSRTDVMVCYRLTCLPAWEPLLLWCQHSRTFELNHLVRLINFMPSIMELLIVWCCSNTVINASCDMNYSIVLALLNKNAIFGWQVTSLIPLGEIK